MADLITIYIICCIIVGIAMFDLTIDVGPEYQRVRISGTKKILIGIAATILSPLVIGYTIMLAVKGEIKMRTSY